MPLESTARIARALARRGYNADREAVTLLGNTEDPDAAIAYTVEAASDDIAVLSAAFVRETLEEYHTQKHHQTSPTSGRNTAGEGTSASGGPDGRKETAVEPETGETAQRGPDRTPSVSCGDEPTEPPDETVPSPDETWGYATGTVEDATGAVEDATDTRETASFATENTEIETATPAGIAESTESQSADRDLEISGDIQSTGTGEYGDFVSVFRDRYDSLADYLRGRVTYRPANSLRDMADGQETAVIGMVADIYETSGGHWRVTLEDTSGTFPCLVLSDRDFASEAQELLCDEVIAVEGTISTDGSGDDGILFVDALYFPDIPHTNRPSTADRSVSAALVSDLHVGSQEFLEDAWGAFTDWLHSEAAETVEYLLVAGDMVEGIGVYPDQDEELDIVDIYDQYERFSEYLKEVPGDMEVVMIPGNHDAVRLAEPQPAFDEKLRDIMSAHEATISANPSTVTIEGVSVLMYHGVSLDEIIAELPAASYDSPEVAMSYLLKKRHLAPKYGGMTRIAPEEADHLVIDEVPDLFHAGHVHKFGYGSYNNVLTVNSSCWQAQTEFQKSVNLDPDVGYAAIVDLQTLDLTYGHFA